MTSKLAQWKRSFAYNAIVPSICWKFLLIKELQGDGCLKKRNEIIVQVAYLRCWSLDGFPRPEKVVLETF